MSNVLATVLYALDLLMRYGPSLAKVVRAAIETVERIAEEWETPEPVDVVTTLEELQRLARKAVLVASTIQLPAVMPEGKTAGDLYWESAYDSVKRVASDMERPLPERMIEKFTQDAYVDARNDADKLGIGVAELAEMEGLVAPEPGEAGTGGA